MIVLTQPNIYINDVRFIHLFDVAVHKKDLTFKRSNRGARAGVACDILYLNVMTVTLLSGGCAYREYLTHVNGTFSRFKFRRKTDYKIESTFTSELKM